jgi:hypothetical protein
VPQRLLRSGAFVCCLALSAIASAQTCYTADDMDAPTRTALDNAAKRYFAMVAQGDSASLKQNAIPALASDFSGIENAVKDNQANLSGAQATPRAPFLLKAEGTAPLARAEFLCGVFGPNGQTANSAEFVITNLSPGNYAISTVDASSPKGSFTVSFVLEQQGAEWKVGGLYIKNREIAGHDGNWFLDRARAFKAKGQDRNAWFYYLEAREMLSPLPFMYTQQTDKLYDEMQAVKPSDLPTSGNTVDLSTAGKTYTVTTVFPLPVGDDLDLVVKYQSADVSNSAQVFKDNQALTEAMVTKFPELRDAFTAVVARAVEPSGRDYGSLFPMKEIK